MPARLQRDDFFLITGASGSGKSTIVAALKSAGCTVVEEIGRQIVQDQQASGGGGTPWQDRRRFRDLLFARSVAAFEAMAGAAGPVFFDRGIGEAVAYSERLGLPAPEGWQETLGRLRYAPRVFVTPPWPEIFENDAERQKDWEEVENDFRSTIQIYAAAGYALIEIPRGSVADRLRFVWQHAGLGSPMPQQAACTRSGSRPF